MKADYSNVILSVIVENVPTMTDPVTLKAYKDGIRVPLSKYLHPNNGFSSYQVVITVYQNLNCSIYGMKLSVYIKKACLCVFVCVCVFFYVF